MNCKIAHVGGSETWRTRLLIRSSIIINFLLFVLTANTKANNLYCNPNDPTSCSFSGVCKRPDLKVGTPFERNSFVCSCPNMNCQSFGYQPECGSDGIVYMNKWCRKLAECSQQQRIDVACHGTCGCTERPTIRYCPESLRNTCINLGECLMSDSDVPYCSCPETFEGPRCEVPVRQTINPNCDDSEGTFNFKLAFLCCLAVLGLLILLITVYSMIRCCHSSKSEECLNFKLNEANEDLEKGSRKESASPSYQLGKLENGSMTIR